MKSKLTLIFIAIAMASHLYGQKTENSNTANPGEQVDTAKLKQIVQQTKKIDELVKKTDSLIQKVNKLNNADSTIMAKIKSALISDSVKTVVGTFKLKVAKVKPINSTKEYAISALNFFVQDGLIKGLRLTLNNGLVFYSNNFISVSYFERYEKYELVLGNAIDSVETYEKLSVKLFSVLAYIPKNGNDYIPDNFSVELTPENSVKAAVLKSGINNVIDIRTYTDFLGLINKESNGIAQFEASTRIITWNNTFQKAQFFNYIRPTFKWVRFDENDKGLKLDSISSDTNILLAFYNRNKMVQKINLDLGFDINIFRLHFSTKAILDFSMNTQFSYVSLISKDETERTGNLWSWGPKVQFSIPRAKNYSFSGSGEVMNQRITRGSGYDDTEFRGIGNAGFKSFYRLQGELDYFPFDDENNQLFLRFISTNGFKSGDKGFNQFQFGTKYNLKL